MIGQSFGLQKKSYKFSVAVLDVQAYNNGLPWTHTATLFLASPKHHHFSITSSVNCGWRRGDLSSSRKSSAPTPSPVVGS